MTDQLTEEGESMNALVTTDTTGTPPAVIAAANPLDLAPEVFQVALTRRSGNRKALMAWVAASLRQGVDFGKIRDKNCLFKPGAEKICGMLGVTPTFPTLARYEDAALSGTELRQIILRCHLIDATGRVVADGIGARSLEQDRGDMNKALKMCAKSAHIDATLRMAGLSEVFTQDLEDMQREANQTTAQTAPKTAQHSEQNGSHPEWVCTPEKRQHYLPKVVDALKAGDITSLQKLVAEMNEGVQRGVWSFLSTAQKKQAREMMQSVREENQTKTPPEEYVAAFRAALHEGIDERVAELYAEVNQDTEMVLSVTKLMTRGEIDQINDAVDRCRG